jgi:hypothetical protein
MEKLHRPAFLQLLKTFLKILAKFIDFWGAESKTEINFYTPVNEFNEEMCSDKR